jgi:phosphoglucosamine mutase
MATNCRTRSRRRSRPRWTNRWKRCRAADLGKVKRIDDAAGRYIEFCKGSFPQTQSLRGLKVVLDCAHGATYNIAPFVFEELGADVTVIGAAPDGFNINRDVGSTKIESLAQRVLRR